VKIASSARLLADKSARVSVMRATRHAASPAGQALMYDCARPDEPRRLWDAEARRGTRRSRRRAARRSHRTRARRRAGAHAFMTETPQTDDKTAYIVLLVDDQLIVGETVRHMLAGSPDLNFHYCADSAGAIGIAESIKPTVILQDLVMPGIDGLTLMKRYRDNPTLKDVPVIVLSSKEDATVKRDAFLAGANDYLVKIPDKIELVARIRLHSNAYINQHQRDEAYRALRASQLQLLQTNADLRSLNQQLEDALTRVKQLSGLLPICSYCKRIRNDQNYWEQVDRYVAHHSEAQFTHGICPTCCETVIAEGDDHKPRR
jgi:DNA-binding response OmpR family regulator